MAPTSMDLVFPILAEVDPLFAPQSGAFRISTLGLTPLEIHLRLYPSVLTKRGGVEVEVGAHLSGLFPRSEELGNRPD